jgi:hypothetical protein
VVALVNLVFSIHMAELSAVVDGSAQRSADGANTLGRKPTSGRLELDRRYAPLWIEDDYILNQVTKKINI